jgi:hypothetical protein
MLAATLTVSLASVSTASAATEFGDSCTANEAVESPITLFEINGAGNPLPTAAPSAGVITAWKVNLVPAPVTIPQTLKVLRPNLGAKTVQVVGEASGSVTGGSNTFPARISVQAGDRLGLFDGGTYGPLLCELPGASTLGGFEGGPGVGSSVPFVEIPVEARVPVSAVVEPDADGDGYGDETQDQCPQSATTQAPCPVVALSAVSAVKKSLATISVTTNTQATVTVAGVVKLGKGKSAKSSGGTQIIAPGTLGKFVLLFPQKLKTALKALPKKRSLTLTVTASAPNVVGAPTVKTLKLHLKGQAKPKKASGKKARS